MSYPAHDGNPQPQGGGYPHYGNQPPAAPYGQPGNYGGPPRKSKVGLWIAVAITGLVLAVLAFTGFVAPAFFLGDDDAAAPSPTQPPSVPGAPTAVLPTATHPTASPSDDPPVGSGEATPQAVANKFLTAVKAKNVNEFKATVCEANFVQVATLTSHIPDGSELKLGAELNVTPTSAEYGVDGSISGYLVASKVNNTYCVSTFVMLSSTPQP